MPRKQVIIRVLSILLILGLSIGGYYLKSSITKDNDKGISRIFDSLDELYDNSDIIIKATVDEEYEEKILSPETRARQYPIKVNEVYYNSVDEEISINDSIILTQSYVNVVNQEVIESGTYILFLDTFKDEEGFRFYTNISKNHLYMLQDDKYVNVGSSKGLEEFQEDELENIIRKNQK